MEKYEVLFSDLLYETYTKMLENAKEDNLLLIDVLRYLLIETYKNNPEDIDIIKELCIKLGKEVYLYNVRASDIFKIMINGEEIDISDQIENYKLIDIPYIDEDTLTLVYFNELGRRCTVVYSANTSKKKAKNKAAYTALKCIGTVTEYRGIDEKKINI